MRLLVDEYAVDWDTAWSITRKDIRLYQPHPAVPRLSSTGLSRCSAKCCPDTSISSSRSTPASSRKVRIRFLGDEARIVAHVAHRRERRPVRPHGPPRRCRQPRGEWRCRPAFATPEAESDERLLRPVAGEVQQQDQRRDAASLARAHQPAPGRGSFATPSAMVG